MKRVIVAALLLTGCTQNQIGDLASAAAIPAYNVAGQAALDRAATLSPAEIAALKAADNQAFVTVIGLNDQQMRRAVDIHRAIQAIPQITQP